MNGAVQYRFDLGNGEGVVRVSTVYVSDGRWHEIRLERDKNSARLTVDGNFVAHGSAPGISDTLNLQTDNMYFGAEVHQHPSILGNWLIISLGNLNTLHTGYFVQALKTSSVVSLVAWTTCE